MEAKINYEIKETTWLEKTFITKRATVAFDKLPEFFGKAYGEIYGAIQKSGLQATGSPCAFYYTINETDKETELAAAVPVHGKMPEVAGLETVVLNPSRVLTTTHYGSYDNMAPAYKAMENYLHEHGLAKELIIEEYFSDPSVEKDPAKWKTNIHFVVT